MTGVLVSVIVPVYERRHCLGDAIESVLAQTHQSLECIVVDDGSTDESYDVAAGIARTEPRVRALRIDHAGVSAARNRGIEDARGPLVTFLDSDDLMVPDRIERQLAVRERARADGVLAKATVHPVGDVVLPVCLPPSSEVVEHYWTSLLVDTGRVREIGGFDVGLEVGEDIDLLVRLREAGARIEVMDDVLTQRRYFGDNLTYRIAADENAFRGAIRRHIARRRAAPA